MKKVALIVAMLVASLAYASDYIDSRLNKAKERHAKIVEKANKELIAAYDTAIKGYTKKGNLEKAMALKEEKDALEENSTETTNTLLPKNTRHVSLIEIKPTATETTSGFPVQNNQSRTGNNPYIGSQECKEYIYAEANSKVSYDIPNGYTKFSATTYTYRSTSCLFTIICDGKEIYKSKPLSTESNQIIKLRLPRGAKKITLVTDGMGDIKLDQTCWCYPRFHK